MMKLRYFYILFLFSFVSATPYGYGTKGGAAAKGRLKTWTDNNNFACSRSKNACVLKWLGLRTPVFWLDFHCDINIRKY